MKKLIRIIINVLPFIYMYLIWYLSSMPSDAIINTGLSFDNSIKEAMHIIEFAFLYLLMVFSMLAKDSLTWKKNVAAAVFSIIYGFTDELHQFFVPDRSATVVDLIKDTFGVVVVWHFINQSYFVKSNSKLGMQQKKIKIWFTKENISSDSADKQL